MDPDSCDDGNSATPGSTDNALERFPHLKQRSREQLSQADSWGGLAWNDQLRSTASGSRDRLIQQLRAMHPALPIDAPVRISQAAPDTRVSPFLTAVLADQLVNDHGDSVQYVLYSEVAEPADKFKGLGAHFGLLDTDRAAAAPRCRAGRGADTSYLVRWPAWEMARRSGSGSS
jgi:hypothetical protein